MPRVLKKIANPQEDISKINQNFDSISLDLADRSGRFSTVGSAGPVVISNNEVVNLEINVIDTRSVYVINKLPIIPRVLMYVGTNGDGTYLYPAGSNLTATQKFELRLEVFVSRVVINEVENEKATYYIVVRNSTGSSQTVYITTDAYYVPQPDTGIANREQ